MQFNLFLIFHAIRLRGARKNSGLDSSMVSCPLDWFLGLYRFVLQRNQAISTKFEVILLTLGVPAPIYGVIPLDSKQYRAPKKGNSAATYFS